MWGELSFECWARRLGASFLWGELSWGELSLGRVVLFPGIEAGTNARGITDNLGNLGFSMGKSENRGFSETIAASDLKGSRS